MNHGSEAARARRLPHGLRSLAIRNFRYYWFSGLGMTGAQGITQLALAWLILDLTGSVGQLGFVIFIQGVAWTIVALVGGILADRYSKRHLLIASQSFTILSLGVLALLTIAEVVQAWHVYASSLILGTNQALTMPARTAIMRSLVGPEDMMNAVALNSFQMQLGRVFWPSLAGVIIGLFGVGPTLLLGATCSLLAVIFLLLLRDLMEPARTSRSSPLKEINEGIRYSFATPALAMIMTLNFAIAFFGLAFINMGPGFAREVLGFSAGMTGAFIMASGIGAIIGSSLLVFRDVQDHNRLVIVTGVGYGLSILVLCLNPFNLAAFGIMLCFGINQSLFAVTAQTIFQIGARQEYLGRVVSLWSMGGGIGSITALPIGVAGDAFGLRYSLGFVSIVLVTIVIAVALTMLPSARRALQNVQAAARETATAESRRPAGAV